LATGPKDHQELWTVQYVLQAQWSWLFKWWWLFTA